jgi:hypothetical protein
LAEQGALSVAFQQGETVIYEVVRPLAFPGDAVARIDQPDSAQARP